MALPIAALGAGVGDGISAVDHHPIAHIDAHMGGVAGVRGVVGVVEEDQVPRLRLVGRDDVAYPFQPLGPQPPHAPAVAAVVDDPRHEAGTVKTCAGGTAAPYIGHSQILLRLGYHPAELLIGQRLARDVIVRVLAPGHAVHILPEQLRTVAAGGHQHIIAVGLLRCQPRGPYHRPQPLVRQLHIEDMIVVRHFHIVVVALAVRPCFCAVSHLHLRREGEGVLLGEQALQGALDLRPGVVLEQDGQVGGQLIGVVADLRQVVAVLVIAGVGAFDIAYLVVQGSLHSGVVRICPGDVSILRRVGGPQHRVPAPGEHGGAGGEHPGDEHDEQPQDASHEDGFGMLFHELDPFIHHRLCSLGGLFAALCRP